MRIHESLVNQLLRLPHDELFFFLLLFYIANYSGDSQWGSFGIAFHDLAV
ncbi:MAG: hypothetical protein ACJAZC_001404 [Cryomorphaceae bacterium]|jgi:hypothetical protein